MAVVRHPGYLGILLYTLATPLVLSSRWAVVTVGLLAVRTALEDATLQRELPGYGEFVGRVRYRLVPWVW